MACTPHSKTILTEHNGKPTVQMVETRLFRHGLGICRANLPPAFPGQVHNPSSTSPSSHNALICALTLQQFSSNDVNHHRQRRTVQLANLSKKVQIKNTPSYYKLISRIPTSLVSFRPVCLPDNLDPWPRNQKTGPNHRSAHHYKQDRIPPSPLSLWILMGSPTSSTSKISFQTGTRTPRNSSKTVSRYAPVRIPRCIANNTTSLLGKWRASHSESPSRGFRCR